MLTKKSLPSFSYILPSVPACPDKEQWTVEGPREEVDMWRTKMIAVAMGLMLAPTFACAGCSGSPTSLASTEKSDVFALRGHRFGYSTIIPDAKDEGVTIGPINLPDDGQTIRNVILGLDVYHPHTEDLQLELGYDADRDGQCDATVEIELHLARGDAHTARALFACSLELDGVWYFRDDADGSAKDPTGVSLSDGVSTFKVFKGLGSGGCFYLTARDTLAEDTGLIRDWMIWADTSVTEPGAVVAVHQFGP
jgi:hypothetical protein